MSDSGLIQHWRQMHWPSVKTLSVILSEKELIRASLKRYHLMTCKVLFFILSIGTLLSLMTFLVELILSRINP